MILQAGSLSGYTASAIEASGSTITLDSRIQLVPTGANAGWVLVYTMMIMMILRFCAAPIVRLLTPIGLVLRLGLGIHGRVVHMPPRATARW